MVSGKPGKYRIKNVKNRSNVINRSNPESRWTTRANVYFAVPALDPEAFLTWQARTARRQRPTVASARAESRVGVAIWGRTGNKTGVPATRRIAGGAAGGQAGGESTLGKAHGQALQFGGPEGAQPAPERRLANCTGAGASADAREIAGGWLACRPHVQTCGHKERTGQVGDGHRAPHGHGQGHGHGVDAS
jgi:hypothetical protein